jgi:hypothetical protein
VQGDLRREALDPDTQVVPDRRRELVVGCHCSILRLRFQVLAFRIDPMESHLGYRSYPKQKRNYFLSESESVSSLRETTSEAEAFGKAFLPESG